MPRHPGSVGPMPRTTTAPYQSTETLLRSVTHPDFNGITHLVMLGEPGPALCGLTIPDGAEPAHARLADCPECVRIHVGESLEAHRNGREVPEWAPGHVDVTTGELREYADLPYPMADQLESGQPLPTIVEAPERAVTVPDGGSGYERLRGHFRATLEKFQVKNTEDGPELVIQLTVGAGSAAAVAMNLPRLLHGLVEVTLNGEGRADAGKQLALWGEE